jgi:hypothetical protein
MSVVSAALITKATDFGVKVCMKLYLRWHKGASHERAERYRKELKEMDDEKANSLRVDSGR